ncbi:TetR/AcrR family transcriptional regulator [Paenibacillus soyae]|uniref:TetR/AcrR family transcriptional regulator n=1 Tax=Paenibacillus soyae TaxID=2969249 RepID=A0A9X2SBU2_9BACL|nr:TetR/AcrR family transcriptional regulator [Paenibacillus soyae]MCR2806018.1 TetR/AcrR family transcriptional regulator [Paenibacillus soyae]
MEKDQIRYKYFEKIKPVFRKNRFSQLNMDDIARHMDISKATMYKYFSSKDDIVKLFVDSCADYFKSGEKMMVDQGISYSERFQIVFEHSLKAAVYVPDILLQDLKEAYPNLLDTLLRAEQERLTCFRQFFEAGVAEGVFNPINPALFLVQDDVVLRRILEPAFTIQFDITLKQALLDYYLIKKQQLITPSFLDSVDDAGMDKKILQVIQQLS